MRSSLFLVALGTCACSHLGGVYEEWHDRPSHPPLRASLMEVDSPGIERQCGRYPGLYVHGCAVRYVDIGECAIFTRAKPERWLVEHERRHCDGWDHEAPPGVPPGVTAVATSPRR